MSRTEISTDDWQLLPLGKVFKLEYGVPLTERDRQPGDVPVIGSAGVVGYHSEAELAGPGVVVGRKGSIGSVTWVAEDFVPIDTTYIAVPVKGRADLRWIYYLLEHEDLSKLNRATGVPGLNRDDVYALQRWIPCIAEQRAIAVVLDGINEAIKHTVTVIAANETAQGTLLAELLSRGVPGWHSEWTSSPGIGNIPADWKSMRLGDVADLRKTQTMPMEDDPRPYVALAHIMAGGTLTGYAKAGGSISSKTEFHQGDILYGKLRPNLRKVIRADFDGVCSTDILAIYGKGGTCPLFLGHLLRSDFLHEHAMRGIAGTKMPRTSWKHLQMFEFGRPPLPEQRAIAAVLDSGAEATKQARTELATLQLLKESAADELLTGRVRVPLAP